MHRCRYESIFILAWKKGLEKTGLGVENLKSRQRQQQSGIGVGMSLQPLALITEGIFHEKTIIEYE